MRQRDPPCSNARTERRTESAAGSRVAASRRLYPWLVRRKSTEGRFGERVVHGVDDAGAEETIVIWVERKQGALWAVGRAVNPQHRSSHEPRRDDYVVQLVALEDVVVAPRLVARPMLGVDGATDRPERALLALDPDHDRLFDARVVDAVDDSL